MNSRNEPVRYAVTRSDRHDDPGTWFSPAGHEEAWFTCPQCGRSADLLETHVVTPSGKVTPSVVCDCGFHEWVTLHGWGSPVGAR